MVSKEKFCLDDIEKDLIILQTKHSMAVFHPQPFLKYHILIFPKSQKSDVDDLYPKERDDIFDMIYQFGNMFDDLGDGFTVLFKEYDDILAVHLVVRKEGDLEENDDIYEDDALKMANFKVVTQDARNASSFLRRKVINYNSS
ncbi:hypothetical protein H312_01753, partial [Anncaliia algerae PRA339]